MSSTVMKNPAASVYEVAGSSIQSKDREDVVPWSLSERCLLWLTILATMYTLYAARSLLLPIAIALTLALLLRPLVGWMSKRIPRGLAALGALLVMAGFIALVIYPIISQIESLGLNDQAQLQEYAGQAKAKFAPVLQWYSEIKETADDLDGAAEISTSTSQPSPLDETVDADEYALDGVPADEAESVLKPEPGESPTTVVEKQQPLIPSALGIGANILANTLLVLILLYFLLAAGDELIANVVALTPGVQEKKRMGQLVNKVEKGVSKYLSTITAINAGLGVAVGSAMWLLGMPAPWLIGFMAFVFNFVPYVGAIVGLSVAALVAVLVFDPNEAALFGFSGQAMWAIVPAVYFLLTNLEGNLVTPTLLGQTMSLNPVLVFLSLVFWGWLWGIGGALLAVPLLAIIRIWCGHFESTKGFAAILGE